MTNSIEDDLKKQCEDLGSRENKIKNLSEALEDIQIEWLLAKLSNQYDSPNTILSRVITSNKNHEKHEIPKKLIEKFNAWLETPNGKKFEAIIPLHVQGDPNSHWIASRIIFKNNNGKIEANAETFDSCGKAQDGNQFLEGSKKLLKRIADKLMANRRYSYNFSQKIEDRLQLEDTNSCGYYMADFCKRLAKDGECNVDGLEKGYLDNDKAKQELINELKSIGNAKPDKNENTDNIKIPDNSNNKQNKNSNTQDIKWIKYKFREVALKTFYESENKNEYSKDGANGKILDKTKLDDNAKTYLDDGELRDNFPLIAGNDLKYLPKELLDAPAKEGKEKFMAKISVKDNMFHVEAPEPIGELNIKMKDGECASDILVSIQFNTLEKERYEFAGIDCNTNCGRLERDRKLEKFNEMRGGERERE